MGKNDKKGADKSGGKAKGGDKEAGGKAKGAQLINVRHILVSVPLADVAVRRADAVCSAKSMPKRKKRWPS